jgi:hypothetical protein
VEGLLSGILAVQAIQIGAQQGGVGGQAERVAKIDGDGHPSNVGGGPA